MVDLHASLAHKELRCSPRVQGRTSCMRIFAPSATREQGQRGSWKGWTLMSPQFMLGRQKALESSQWEQKGEGWEPHEKAHGYGSWRRRPHVHDEGGSIPQNCPVKTVWGSSKNYEKGGAGSVLNSKGEFNLISVTTMQGCKKIGTAVLAVLRKVSLQ